MLIAYKVQLTVLVVFVTIAGQFTGHTGAKVLTQAELSLGVQAWAKQDQFDKAPKVQGGFGEFLLKKMGWSGRVTKFPFVDLILFQPKITVIRNLSM